MSDSDDGKEIDIEVHEIHSKEQAEAIINETVTYAIAKDIMEMYGPGFVVIGSPNFNTSDEGVSYPDSVAMVLASSLNLTRSSFAEILHNIADSLEEKIDEVEAYANTGDTE